MQTGTFIINSTLDNARGLLSKYTYDDTKSDLPIVVLIHGFNLTIDAITQDILNRIANQGFFVVAVGMRGRKGATGSRDASAREIHDIYDAINHIKDNYPVSDKVIVSGYSGGGGNALGFAVKFPYVANTIVNHFGMVDYGYDDVESWYIRNSGYRANIESFVGHSRIPSNMNYYRSRNAYEALTNVKAKLYSYHDTADSGVSVELTNYLTSGLQALSKNYETHISTPSDSVRYLHNMGVSEKTEHQWLPYGNTADKPTMNTSDSFRVIGYIVTDEFKVFLGNLDDHVADVSYDLTSDQFTINPLTGTMQVKVVKDNLQQVLNITEETTFIFDGEEIPGDPDSEQVKVKHMFIKKDGVFIPVKTKYTKSNDKWIDIK